MKIGQSLDNSVSVSSTAASAPSKVGHGTASAARSAAPAGAPAAGVEVTVSSLARSMGANRSGGAEFNTDKVNAMKLAIKNGTFSVNAGAIADKLLSNAQEMLHQTRL